jgi:hypothetical protein
MKLTEYDLSIGAVYTINNKDKTKTVKLHKEYNAYHVRVFFKDNGCLERKAWLVFDKYAKARDCFKELGRDIK